jgi:glycosyltransferase involved in cell wall biosynthesis
MTGNTRTDGDTRTVSVVIPAYNCEAYIGDAVESVLNQTVPAHEVVVVDDGSTDGTREILQRFTSRIRVISRSNAGPSAARNAGVAAATGHWIGFLDGDDAWLPSKLERQLAVGMDPSVAVVYSDRFNIGNRGNFPEIQGQIQRMYSGDVFEDLMLLGNHITNSSVLIRAAVFRELGGFDEQLPPAEDWDLWIRVAEKYRIGVCPEPLVRYRFHGGMISGNPQKMCSARDKVIRRGLATTRGRCLGPRMRRKILAAVSRTNAWDAARRRANGLAFREYLKALVFNPWKAAVYVDILRFVLGRHV